MDCLRIARIGTFGFLFNVLALAQVNFLTQHNDSFRTGANLNETILNTSNVNVNQFGKLFSRRVDGQIYAEPLFVSNLTIPGKGAHNVVYVATAHNSVYAFDADNPAASTPLWVTNLGPSVYFKQVSLDINLRPEMGIISTPVIDANSRTMYVVAYTSEAGTQVYRLHALDITTGSEKLTPAVIQGSVQGTGPDNVNGTITFNPVHQLQRPALLLSNGILYIGFGSHADLFMWHGWIFAYNASTLQRVAVYSTTPNGSEGSVWQSGQGPTVDENGFVYFVVGNGTSTPDGLNIGEGFGKLQFGGSTLAQADWFIPSDAATLNTEDQDTGSGGALHIPGTQRIMGGGKDGMLYVLNTANLGHTGQPVQALQVCLNGGRIHGSPIYWNSPTAGPKVYVWCDQDFLRAFNFANGQVSATPAQVGTIQAPQGIPGGTLSLSANGSTAGSGIVWSAMPFNANAIHQTVEGVLRAVDAENLTRELWNSKQNDTRDDVGDFAKFTPPLVANGKVYLATFSGQLLVYGLLPAPAARADTYAINAGGSAEGPFAADSRFSGGTEVTSGLTQGFDVEPKAVANPAPQLVYRTARQGNFTYTLSSLTPGLGYSVRLHFVEFQATAAGQRRFNVAINGVRALTDFDIFQTTGGQNIAIDRTFTAIADPTGTISVQFTNGSVGSAQVNGIEIAPIGSSSATLVGQDSTTQGNWIGPYGANGYNIVGYASNNPAYATVGVIPTNTTQWTTSTTDVRALRKLPPATDRTASAWSASTNFVLDVNLTDGATHRVSLYLLDWDTNNLRSENIDIVDAATGVVLDNQIVTSFSGGKYLSWNLKGHVQFRLAAMSDSGNTVLTGLFFDPPQSGGGQAAFVKTDTTTQGNWKGVYGGGGYMVINDSQSFPATVELSASGQTAFTWSSDTTDPRALQRATTGRIAASWFANPRFSISLNLADSLPHQVALYFLDWDNQQRVLRVDVLDAVTRNLLDTESVTAFGSGKYLVWRLKGNVEIDITSTVGTAAANAVVSGIFLDGPAGQAQVSFVGQDAASEGTWTGVYGTDGYDVINGAPHYPAYALVTPVGQQPFTWASPTTDPRALQNPAAPGTRLAAAWFNPTSFSIDVNQTDGAPHKVSLYFLDWDKTGRVERVELLDAVSGEVLDTRQISSFANGIYLTWQLTGHVQIRLTSLVASVTTNAVVSGIFFGEARVAFVGQDPSTEGTWQGIYGADGFNVINGEISYPTYAVVTPSGQQPFTWASSTTDTRALLNPGSAKGDRIAACWFNPTTFTIDVNLTDGVVHKVSLYFLDWDENGRSEKVELLDSSGAVLDTRAISSFTSGVYLSWKITGDVKFRITSLVSANAVVSGLFFQ